MLLNEFQKKLPWGFWMEGILVAYQDSKTGRCMVATWIGYDKNGHIKEAEKTLKWLNENKNILTGEQS